MPGVLLRCPRQIKSPTCWAFIWEADRQEISKHIYIDNIIRDGWGGTSDSPFREGCQFHHFEGSDVFELRPEGWEGAGLQKSRKRVAEKEATWDCSWVPLRLKSLPYHWYRPLLSTCSQQWPPVFQDNSGHGDWVSPPGRACFSDPGDVEYHPWMVRSVWTSGFTARLWRPSIHGLFSPFSLSRNLTRFL